MTQRKSHTGKTKFEKDYYSRIIKNLDYEPTVDETIKFPESDDSKKDFSVAKSSSKRKISLKEKLSYHFEENWLHWVIGVVAAVLLFLMVNSKVDIKGIETNVENIKEDVEEVKGSQKEINDKLHKQDMKIQENQLRIESLSKNDAK